MSPILKHTPIFCLEFVQHLRSVVWSACSQRVVVRAVNHRDGTNLHITQFFNRACYAPLPLGSRARPSSSCACTAILPA